ncbi:MAG TPA: tetratricopeptide repeat protein [Thermoplasmata archaeon]|nr:tetratricopeptide repeat protein [Thermoplasmata archaeon]
MDSQRYDIAVSYFIRGQFERAARSFSDLLAEAPAEPRCWTYLGMSYAHLGRAAEAEQALSKAIELGPRNPDAWFHLGVARGMRSEWTRAVSAYRYAVALAPEDLVAWHRLGVALAESGDEAGSEAAFERALVLSRETGEKGPDAEEGGASPSEGPENHLSEGAEPGSGREAKSWLDLALSLLSLGEEEEAIAAYERAYTLDPGQAQLSLFRPMLRLVASAAIGTGSEGAPSHGAAPPRPRPPGPSAPEPELSDIFPDIP